MSGHTRTPGAVPVAGGTLWYPEHVARFFITLPEPLGLPDGWTRQMRGRLSIADVQAPERASDEADSSLDPA